MRARKVWAAETVQWTAIDISSRMKSWKNGRTLHLLSNHERAFALLLDWDPAVLDFFEQYPLLPLVDTLAYGEQIGYLIAAAHSPTDWELAKSHFCLLDASAQHQRHTSHGLRRWLNFSANQDLLWSPRRSGPPRDGTP